MSMIEDLQEQYGIPVRYELVDEDSVKFFTDKGKVFKMKKAGATAQYFIRDLDSAISDDGMNMGIVLPDKTKLVPKCRLYIVNDNENESIIKDLQLSGNTKVFNFEEIEKLIPDVLNAIEEKKPIIMRTTKSLLGFKNTLTTLMKTGNKDLYEYIFDYLYMYVSPTEKVRMVNLVKMTLLQDKYLKESDIDPFIKINLTDKDDIGNMLLNIQAEMGMREISDCSIAVGAPVMMRVGKALEPQSQYPKITEKIALLIEDDLMAIAPLSKRKEYLETGTTRIALTHPKWGRYRVSLGRQRGSLSISMRLIPKDIRDLNDFRLPKKVVHKLLSKQGGLYLIVGVPNSGKSTLAASVIDQYLKTKPIKICTAERPIEYLFEHGMGLVTQHEIGDDISDFQHIKEMLLTYDPDIVYGTETKNPMELKTNIEMAESGKFVLTTLHAGTVEDALSRIKGMLDGDTQAIAGFASVLKLIIVQQLVPRQGGGLVPAQEIFNVQPNQKSALVKFDMNSLTSDLMDQKLGNRLMVNDLWNLNQQHKISDKTFRALTDLELLANVSPQMYRAEYDVVESEEEKDALRKATLQAKEQKKNLDLARKGRL